MVAPIDFWSVRKGEEKNRCIPTKQIFFVYPPTPGYQQFEESGENDSGECGVQKQA